MSCIVAVAVTFFVCWAPFHTQRIITSCVGDDEWTPALIELQHGLFHVSGKLRHRMHLRTLFISLHTELYGGNTWKSPSVPWQ